MLDRFVDRYLAHIEKHGVLPNIDKSYLKICPDLAALTGAKIF